MGELEKYWMASYQLQGREPGTLMALKGVEQFQVYCFRNGSLSNCQSTGDKRAARFGGVAAGAGTPGTPGGNPNTPGAAPGVSGAAAALALFSLPEAVRCQLTLGEGSGYAGRLSRDVMVAPVPVPGG